MRKRTKHENTQSSPFSYENVSRRLLGAQSINTERETVNSGDVKSFNINCLIKGINPYHNSMVQQQQHGKQQQQQYGKQQQQQQYGTTTTTVWYSNNNNNSMVQQQQQQQYGTATTTTTTTVWYSNNNNNSMIQQQQQQQQYGTIITTTTTTTTVWYMGSFELQLFSQWKCKGICRRNPTTFHLTKAHTSYTVAVVWSSVIFNS